MTKRDCEAAVLRRLFEGVTNKAAFARAHGVPGGASMVSQHLSGNRPLSFEAALAYARGFDVPLSTISPFFAELARQAAALETEVEPRSHGHGHMHSALTVFATALTSLTSGQWLMVRGRLDCLPSHPEMRDDVIVDILPVLAMHAGNHFVAGA